MARGLLTLDRVARVPARPHLRGEPCPYRVGGLRWRAVARTQRRRHAARRLPAGVAQRRRRDLLACARSEWSAGAARGPVRRRRPRDCRAVAGRHATRRSVGVLRDASHRTPPWATRSAWGDLGAVAGRRRGQLLRPHRHPVHLHSPAPCAGGAQQRAAGCSSWRGQAWSRCRAFAVVVHHGGDRTRARRTDQRGAGDVPADRHGGPGRVRAATTCARYGAAARHLAVLRGAAPGGAAAAVARGTAHPSRSVPARRRLHRRGAGLLPDSAAHPRPRGCPRSSACWWYSLPWRC